MKSIVGMKNKHHASPTCLRTQNLTCKLQFIFYECKVPLIVLATNHLNLNALINPVLSSTPLFPHNTQNLFPLVHYILCYMYLHWGVKQVIHQQFHESLISSDVLIFKSSAVLFTRALGRRSKLISAGIESVNSLCNPLANKSCLIHTNV